MTVANAVYDVGTYDYNKRDSEVCNVGWYATSQRGREKCQVQSSLDHFRNATSREIILQYVHVGPRSCKLAGYGNTWTS